LMTGVVITGTPDYMALKDGIQQTPLLIYSI
jgi:hypothetical protein